MLESGLKILERSVIGSSDHQLDDNEKCRAHYMLSRTCILYFTMDKLLADESVHSLENPILPAMHEPKHINGIMNHLDDRYPFLQ
jgi:hypothetical protein